MRVYLAAALSILSACSFGLTLEPPGSGSADTAGLGGDDPWDDPTGDGTGDSGDDGSAQDLPATAVELDGKLYAISADALTVVEPPGLDALFDQVLTRDVLVYVEQETDSALFLDVALAGADGKQDPCEAVRAFPAADWTANPRFAAGPGELVTSFAGHPATFRHLDLAGTFDEYAFQWRDGRLDAMLDTRELAPALPDVDDLCGLVENLGGACEACDDGEDACFALAIEDITAELVDGTFEPDRRGSDCAQ